MPDDLTAYLASRYLAADTKPSKKRKRKHNSAPGADGLLITDDDDAGWTTKGQGGGNGDGDDDGDVVMGATVAGTSSAFRKAKTNNWTVLGGATNTTAPASAPKADTDADAIIAAAAAEAAAQQDTPEDAPAVDGAVDGAAAAAAAAAVLMSDGTHAGLQSAASVTAQLERRRREEREQYERERKEKRERRKKNKGGEDDNSEGEEVVYRDATGRRVDIALRRQEAQQAAREGEAKARAAQDALRGDVQREAARRRREELAEAALLPVARGADDADMNRELRDQARWNDPMAEFLAKKKETAAARSAADGSGAKGGRGGRSRRPVYTGAAAPNRYGIRPGYRWDGVDRSIGFEAERFKAANRRERVKNLEYEWQMDE